MNDGVTIRGIKIDMYIYVQPIKKKKKKKKKRNTPTNFNTNYRIEIKLVPINMDYCLFQCGIIKFFL